ncbi:MAG TPA: TetR family transcriptional regulator [Cellulomonas sp.]
MRSAPLPSDDLTARARIRDAALLRFARDGFGASVRSIATDAEVSPALVIHHFGSKDALRADCDAYVLQRIRDQKTADLTTGTPREVMSQIADLAAYGPLFGYLVRSLSVGGPLAARFVDDLVVASRAYLDAAVAAGTMTPSRDPDGRARYAVAQTIGLLQLAAIDAEAGRAPSPTLDPVGAIARLGQWAYLPALELFTEPMLTGSGLLDAYLDTVGSPDPATDHADPSAPHDQERP